MTEASQREAAKASPWLNRLMKFVLETPVLHRLVSGSLALITFEGRRTGRVYTTPVSYRRHGNAVVVLSGTNHVWWRNLTDKPRVQLRIAGRGFSGIADVRVGSDGDLNTVREFLTDRKVDARVHDVSLGPDGEPNAADLRRQLPNIVVIRIALTERATSEAPSV